MICHKGCRVGSVRTPQVFWVQEIVEMVPKLLKGEGGLRIFPTPQSLTRLATPDGAILISEQL